MENIKRKDIKKGDCFAYEITDNAELKGRFLILLETGLTQNKMEDWNFFRLKITSENVLPKTQEEIDMLEDVITTLTYVENRFFPFSGKESEKKQIEERSKVPIDPDERGFLYSYTIRIVLTNKLFKKFTYLGNFIINDNINRKEFLPFNLINLASFSGNFERMCLLPYFWYNKRESDIWKFTQEEINKKVIW